MNARKSQKPPAWIKESIFYREETEELGELGELEKRLKLSPNQLIYAVRKEEHKEEIVGYINYSKEKCEIAGLLVKTAYQANGIGHTLFRKAIDDAKSNCEYVNWRAHRDSIGWYERQGAKLIIPDPLEYYLDSGDYHSAMHIKTNRVD